MSLDLTTSLASTITKAELELNFSSIESKFDGNIDNSDIKAAAGIAISKLAASKEYVCVNLFNPAYAWTSSGVIAMAALPGLSGDQANWVLTDANWFINDVGDGAAGTLDVVLAYYNGSGILTDRTILINEIAMVIAVNNTGNSGEAPSITSGAVNYDSSEPRLLVLRQGGTTGSNIGTVQIGVTLLLERDIQS